MLIASFKKCAMEGVGETILFGPHLRHSQRHSKKKEKRERRRISHTIFTKMCCCKGRMLPLGDLFILRQKLWAWRGDFPMKCCGLCYAGSKTLWVLLVTESFKDISACLQDTFTGVSLSGQVQLASQQMNNFHWLHSCLGKNWDLGSWFLFESVVKYPTKYSFDCLRELSLNPSDFNK